MSPSCPSSFRNTMNNPAQAFYNWYKNTLNHPKYRWILVVGTLLYLLSPIDISPDFIPIIGWIDDGIVASIFVASLSQLLLSGLTKNRTDLGADYADTTVDINPDA
ncbi:MAG: YkvA family protein [Leptolyngbya sp.]|nr:YkvA family protein [Leptolyngbya sp.]